MSLKHSLKEQNFLGIEGGGTRTTAILIDAAGRVIREDSFGPGNVRLLSDEQLRELFNSVAQAFAPPAAVAIGMAGARTAADRRRIQTAAGHCWPHVPNLATHDLDTALAAADATSPLRAGARVLVISGTGSCCYGRTCGGQTAKCGGWGHLLGDRGSGYDIALRALRECIRSFDGIGAWPKLAQNILSALQLNEPEDLLTWIQGAEKSEVAALAETVLSTGTKRDALAIKILTAAAADLALDAVHCARKLQAKPVEFILSGSLLLKQPIYGQLFMRQVKRHLRFARFISASAPGALGAALLAKTLVRKDNQAPPMAPNLFEAPAQARALPRFLANLDLAQSPTEQRNPRSFELDKLPLAQAIDLMLREDARIPAALRRESEAMEAAVRLIVRAFKRRGRLFYAGAGTSGRLGVLDASECPPTFRTPPDQVQAIMAGGQQAIWSSIEGAEDDYAAGARAVEFRGINKRDILVAIAASGRTPFAWGALTAARARGAATVLITFNPKLSIPAAHKPTMVIAVNTGPEILTGSTRLKAGTATKMILNLLTTLSMVQTGKVISNLMVDVNPSNAKLRDRAIRIVRQLTQTDEAAARSALETSEWVIKGALRKLQKRKQR